VVVNSYALSYFFAAVGCFNSSWFGLAEAAPNRHNISNLPAKLFRIPSAMLEELFVTSPILAFVLKGAIIILPAA
jgi:hypothetical protein